MGREKRRSNAMLASRFLRKEAFSQTIELKNVDYILLSCPCKFITSGWRFTWVPFDSNVSTSKVHSQNLFSLANNGTKAWTVIQPINKC